MMSRGTKQHLKLIVAKTTYYWQQYFPRDAIARRFVRAFCSTHRRIRSEHDCCSLYYTEGDQSMLAVVCIILEVTRAKKALPEHYGAES